MRFFKKNITKFPQAAEYAVEEAFSIKGRPFFQFVDSSNIPAGRSLAALKYYLPLQTSCDEKYLGWFQKSMDVILSDTKSISIEKLIGLKNQLKDRLELYVHPKHLYKYASVVYMDKDENPYTYDEVANDKKIEFWKANTGMQEFFFAEPITKLLPFLKNARFSAPAYSVAVLEQDITMHRNLLQLLSSSPSSAGDILNLKSAIMELQNLRNYAASQQTNTSSSSNISINKRKKLPKHGK